ncbi:MAG TPA: ABC transporter ATP-binding protein [Rectinemataceae bacterium]|nr:ABC transporter ATP-binding protein [Rectinemataceae bacterium]
MKKPRNIHIAWIWHIWKEKKGLIALLLFLTLLSSLVAVAFPLLTKELFDMLEGILSGKGDYPDPLAALRKAALFFIGLGVAGFVSGFFPGIRGALNVVFDYIIRKKYFAELTEKDYRFFAEFSSGDLVTRLTSDINDFPKLSWFLCSGIFRAIESASKVVFCAIAMVALDWRLALFSIASLPFMLYIFSRTQDRIYDKVKRNEESISRINEQLELSFSGARIIKAFASEAKYERFFSEALERRYKTEMDVIKLDTILNLIYQNIDYVAQIALIFAGGLMVVKGEITIGTFYAFYNYLNLLIYPILDIPQLFIFGKRAFVNIDRLEEIGGFPRAPEPASPIAISRFEKLEVGRASFGYKGREKRAVSEVSFELARGERLLVIGPVGCGKTSLVKMIAGLLPAQEGGISVNGIPLSGLSKSDWAALVGYVPQEALLFSGTIEDNVAFGVRRTPPLLSSERFWELAETAQIDEEIRSFPLKEKTPLGQRGVSVSGGQKQRIAIARALAREPELLLLDDMTASLDTKNEERLWKALDRSDTTIIAVSHRLSSVQYADKVLFLKEGSVAGFGRHETLMETNGEYRAFVASHISG